MRGYQSIANSSVDDDGLERGISPIENSYDITSSPSTPTSLFESPYTIPSFASRLGYIAFGIIIGIISSRGPLRWRDDSSTNQPILLLGASSPNSQQKSFVDSVPFEDTVPLLTSWNPAVPREHDPLKPVKNHTDLLSSWNPAQPRQKTSIISSNQEMKPNPALSAIRDESNILKASTSLLSASISSSASNTQSSPGPHILYHAHPSSFSLLYDTSKASDNYISEYSLDYFLINSGGFDVQINQAYCAVATVATILNSLKYAKRFREGDSLSFDLPLDKRYDPYPYATQQDILVSDCVWNNVIEHGDGGEHGNVNGIFKPPYGLSLEQSSKLLECHTSNEWEVIVKEADPSQLTLNKMRFDLKTALVNPDARVLINYDRKELGQVGGGHFSPLGGYHASTDSFLIVDVAKYKYPPVWVGSDTLWKSLSTYDKCGTWDYPHGQARLNTTTSDGTNKFINPISKEDYVRSLDLLNCKQKMRGYIILKKKTGM